MSAFAFGGVPARVLRSVLSTSEVCVSENVDQWQSLVAGIAAFVAEARLVHPTRPVRACRDPKDDMVLECCRAARARFLITGDRDLLSLDVAGTAGLRRLRIVSPRAYLDRR